MKMPPKCIMLNKIPSYAKCLETDVAAESKEPYVKLEKQKVVNTKCRQAFIQPRCF